MLNPEAPASTLAISSESNGESAVCTATNHSPMEQTSTATTKGRPVPDTPHKTPYTHHGTQKTSRSGRLIRPYGKFNYDENSSKSNHQATSIHMPWFFDVLIIFVVLVKRGMS